MGSLYIVPTPIGNLEDITLRALRVLREAAFIAAEDTRTTGRLLAHYGIDTPQISYHEHNELKRLNQILDVLAAGDVALVSDAGTPGLSDPGFRLVEACIQHGVKIIPLPGASALLPAVVASGLSTDSFLYLGFLPRKHKARLDMIEAAVDVRHTLVFYEAPHRLVDSLGDLLSVLGDRRVAVCRELTKLYEEIYRAPLSEAITYYMENPPRGEITLVVEGAASPKDIEWDEEHVRTVLEEELAAGKSRSAAAKAVAAVSGWNKGDIYNLDV